MEVVIKVLQESIKITLFVLVMMVAVDFINVNTNGKLESIQRTRNMWKQYFVASLFGLPIIL